MMIALTNPMVLVAPLLVFLAVTLGALALLMPRSLAVRSRLEALTRGPENSQTERHLAKPLFQRAVAPLIQRFGGLLSRFAPQTMVEETARQLVQAGRPANLTPSGFLVLKAVIFLALPGLYGLFLLRAGSVGLPHLIGLGVILLLALRCPDMWLKRKAEGRMVEVNRALPDALDLMVICIEAGLGFDAALGRVADRMKGPLADEIRRTLSEMSMGKRRRDALKTMVTRCPAPDLVSFVAVVSQADQTGVSIGNVLRIQADALRVKRRQRAQEEGHKAPLKMLFPMIFFILPATFGVILGPTVLKVMDSLVPAMSGGR